MAGDRIAGQDVSCLFEKPLRCGTGCGGSGNGCRRVVKGDEHVWILNNIGLFSVTTMLVFYALEHRNHWFI